MGSARRHHDAGGAPPQMAAITEGFRGLAMAVGFTDHTISTARSAITRTGTYTRNRVAGKG
jgi:hypothetical protein